MKFGLTAAILIVGCALATAAGAQAPQSADPGFQMRLDLARKVMEASGGNAQGEATIKSLYASINKLISSNLTSPQASKLAVSLQEHMERKLIEEVPNILEQSAQVYARNLTEKELRDEIVWLESDSAKSIRAKMPVIRDQIIQGQAPMFQAMMPQLMNKAADEACEESHCTADDRKLIAAMMTNLVPGRPHTATP